MVFPLELLKFFRSWERIKNWPREFRKNENDRYLLPDFCLSISHYSFHVDEDYNMNVLIVFWGKIQYWRQVRNVEDYLLWPWFPQFSNHTLGHVTVHVINKNENQTGRGPTIHDILSFVLFSYCIYSFQFTIISMKKMYLTLSEIFGIGPQYLNNRTNIFSWFRFVIKKLFMCIVDMIFLCWNFIDRDFFYDFISKTEQWWA